MNPQGGMNFFVLTVQRALCGILALSLAIPANLVHAANPAAAAEERPHPPYRLTPEDLKPKEGVALSMIAEKFMGIKSDVQRERLNRRLDRRIMRMANRGATRLGKAIIGGVETSLIIYMFAVAHTVLEMIRIQHLQNKDLDFEGLQTIIFSVAKDMLEAGQTPSSIAGGAITGTIYEYSGANNAVAKGTNEVLKLLFQSAATRGLLLQFIASGTHSLITFVGFEFGAELVEFAIDLLPTEADRKMAGKFNYLLYKTYFARTATSDERRVTRAVLNNMERILLTDSHLRAEWIHNSWRLRMLNSTFLINCANLTVAGIAAAKVTSKNIPAALLTVVFGVAISYVFPRSATEAFNVFISQSRRWLNPANVAPIQLPTKGTHQSMTPEEAEEMVLRNLRLQQSHREQWVTRWVEEYYRLLTYREETEFQAHIAKTTLESMKKSDSANISLWERIQLELKDLSDLADSFTYPITVVRPATPEDNIRLMQQSIYDEPYVLAGIDWRRREMTGELNRFYLNSYNALGEQLQRLAKTSDTSSILYFDRLRLLMEAELSALREVIDRIVWFSIGLNSEATNISALESYAKDPKRFLGEVNSAGLSELRTAYRKTFQEDHWRNEPAPEEFVIIEEDVKPESEVTTPSAAPTAVPTPRAPSRPKPALGRAIPI